MGMPNIEESTKKLSDRIQPQLEDVKRRIDDANEKVTSFIQEHPAACLFGAVALGYVIARVARRQRS